MISVGTCSARGESAAAAWGGKLLVSAMRWASSTKAQAHIDVPWAAKYVSNNPCIRFIAIDDQKRNLESPEYGPSMVVHTSVPFGVKHLEEAKEQVEPIILVKLNKLLPGLPQPDSIKCQKWRYSQVTSSVADCPGQMTPLSQPLLVCGGDGFTHSNFDGCIESALKVFDVLKSSVGGMGV